MMNDSVREELQLNISAPSIPVNDERKAFPINSGRLEQSAPTVLPRPAPAMVAKHVPVRTITSELPAKNTNPTLVGFQNQNATMPDWRLQLQNAVRQRAGGAAETVGESAPVVYQKQLVTSGANALKAEYVTETAEAGHVNPKVAAALKRIEQSRQRFSPEEKPAPAPQRAAPAANKNYPFNVVSRTPGSVPKPAVETTASVNVLPKPKLVSSLRLGKEVLDTNKLPPLPESIKIASSFDKPFSAAPKRVSGPLSDEVIHIPSVEEAEPVEETILEVREAEVEEIETDEIEDLAPFSVRFNAGLFDLIIGAFTSMVLLSPFVLMGGNWFTWAGLFALGATSAVVMFIYLTTCLGLFGKTLGMRIFSLEVVDIEESDYPTFHQAALSSTIYLLSLAFGGIGFLTVPFNEERRAMHDLLSGTIVVKEF
jgi:uncharacterized RDD family membrane protein YckC